MVDDEGISEPEPTGGGEMRSHWQPKGTVGRQHKPGVYHLDRINLRSAAGRIIVLRAEEHLERYPEEYRIIRVIDEPDATPYFGTVSLQ